MRSYLLRHYPTAAITVAPPLTWQQEADALQRQGLTLTEIAVQLGIDRERVVAEMYDRVTR